MKMRKDFAGRFVLLLGVMLTAIAPCLLSGEVMAATVYGSVPGKWTLNEKGFRNIFVPEPGYGHGVYAVKGMSADVVLALDTDGEGFAECKKISAGQGLAQPIADSSCFPKGVGCTFFPYQCSSELVKPIFIDTEVRPTSSERLTWLNSTKPIPAFKPIQNTSSSTPPFYFERSCNPAALKGKVLFQGAWLIGPNDFHRGIDGSFPASVYEHFGRALYFREDGGIKFLATPSLDFGEASAFEPAVKYTYQDDATGGTTLHAEPQDHPKSQQYPFRKIYTVPGGYWLEIDWDEDFEGAGVRTNTLILQVINGEISTFTTAEGIRMY